MPARITGSLVVILPLVFISATPAQTRLAVACAGLADQRLPNTTSASLSTWTRQLSVAPVKDY